MSEIPADIMSAAISVADKVSFGGYEQNALAIARAILAERERCAFAVETHSGSGDQATIDAMSGQWQPIDTAPRDRDIILGIAFDEEGDGFEHVTQGRWIDAEEDQIDQPGHDAGFVDCEYLCFFPGRSFGPEKHQFKGTQPTHWQLLPKPPSPTHPQLPKESAA